MNLIERLKRARNAGVPLVAVRTADPTATMANIVRNLKDDVPAVSWDIASGTNGVNDLGVAVGKSTGRGAEGDMTVRNPLALLTLAMEFPVKTTVFMQNADFFVSDEDPSVVQAAFNLRDPFKANGRMLIMLSPTRMDLPDALRGHVEGMSDPLPDAEALQVIIKELDQSTCDDHPGRKPLDEKTISKAVEAVRGLNAFAAEQAVAMALRKKGIDIDELWETKRGLLEQVAGLSVDDGEATFADVGGLDQAKELGKGLFGGPVPPAVVVKMEEIGKAMSGAQASGGDSSGTSQGGLAKLLTYMEDESWMGMIAYGPAGTGKSFYSKVLAKTFGALPLTLDVEGTKDKLVGESGKRMEAAMETIKAIGGKRVFFVATSNELDTLPPELLRRFRLGVWYFDMPNAEEKTSIWQLNRERFGVNPKDEQPDDSLYSAANIRDICEIAYRTGRSLKESETFILPAGVVGKEQIEKSQTAADGKYLSASYPGVYRRPVAGSAPSSKRKRSVVVD